jgi:hypothetical protein
MKGGFGIRSISSRNSSRTFARIGGSLRYSQLSRRFKASRSSTDPTAVTVELQGGLGNQLFGFAAGLEQAKRLETPLQLGFVSRRRETQRDFELNFLLSEEIRFGVLNRSKIIFRETSFAYDKRIQDLQPGSLLKGYFQSWKYFESSSEEVRTLVRSGGLTDKEKSGPNITQPFIGLQVRRGDYLQPKTSAYHGICGFEYFSRGLHLLRDQLGQLPAVVFSDDPLVAREFAKGLPNCLPDEPHETESAIETLRRISRGSGFVISNSSFGWWAAWLAGDVAPCVAPSPWFASPDVDTRDLLPPHWQTIHQFN